MIHLCLAGTGLVGTSAALTLRAQNALHKSIGWDPDPTRLQRAQDLGALDTVLAFPQDALPQADVILVDLDPKGLARFNTLYAQHVRPDAIIARLGNDTRVILSPTQRAKTPPSPSLLHDRLCIIEGDPHDTTEAFWQKLGCRVRWIPKGHAATLHAASDQTPTLAAAALVTMLDELSEVFTHLEGTGPEALDHALAGAAAHTPQLIAELQHNRDALLCSLPRLISVLQDIEGWVLLKQWDRLEALLERAHARRADFLDKEIP